MNDQRWLRGGQSVAITRPIPRDDPVTQATFPYQIPHFFIHRTTSSFLYIFNKTTYQWRAAYSHACTGVHNPALVFCFASSSGTQVCSVRKVGEDTRGRPYENTSGKSILMVRGELWPIFYFILPENSYKMEVSKSRADGGILISRLNKLLKNWPTQGEGIYYKKILLGVAIFFAVFTLGRISLLLPPIAKSILTKQLSRSSSWSDY